MASDKTDTTFTTLENQIAACLNVKRKSADYYRDEDRNLYKVTRNGWKKMKKARKRD